LNAGNRLSDTGKRDFFNGKGLSEERMREKTRVRIFNTLVRIIETPVRQVKFLLMTFETQQLRR